MTKKSTTIGALTIFANEIVGEVGTIDDALTDNDSSIEPLVSPPVVEDAEAKTYKFLQQSMIDLNADGNDGLGEDGETILCIVSS